jgi:hypothetical protein
MATLSLTSKKKILVETHAAQADLARLGGTLAESLAAVMTAAAAASAKDSAGGKVFEGVMDQANAHVTMLSNLLKTMSDIQDSVISNIR